MVDEMEIHLMIDSLWWIGPTSFNANLRCDSFSFGSILGLEYEEQYEMLVKYKTSLDLGLTEG